MFIINYFGSCRQTIFMTKFCCKMALMPSIAKKDTQKILCYHKLASSVYNHSHGLLLTQSVIQFHSITCKVHIDHLGLTSLIPIPTILFCWLHLVLVSCTTCHNANYNQKHIFKSEIPLKDLFPFFFFFFNFWHWKDQVP